MFYRCASCNTVWMSKGAEPIMTSMPYVAKLEDSYCCAECVTDHDGPGKFEACRGSRGELGKALILYSRCMESGEDDFMSSEGYGYCGRFGQYLLFEDDRGAVSFWDEGTPEKAEREFNRLYEEGMGADEYDGYIESDGFRYSVAFNGKPLDVWENNNGEITMRRCIARVRLEASKTGYYPNLWFISDHGNLSRVNY